MSDIGLLIKTNNITWSQIEEYLKAKGTDASTISNLHTVFDKETGRISDGRNRLDTGSDGISIYDNTCDNSSLEDADNIFQEADPQKAKLQDNADVLSVSQSDKDALLQVILEVSKGVSAQNTAEERGGTPAPENTPQFTLNYQPTSFNISDIQFNNPFGGYGDSYIQLPDINFNSQFNSGFSYNPNITFGDINFDFTPYSPDYSQINPPTYNFGGITTPTYNYPNFDFNIPISIQPFNPNGNNNPIGTPDNNPPTANRTPERDEHADEVRHDEVEKEDYPPKMKELLDGIKQESAEHTIEKTKKGYRVTITSGDQLERIDAKSMTLELDKKGRLKTQTIKYNNGTIMKSNHTEPPRSVLYDDNTPDNVLRVAENISNIEYPSEKTTVEYNSENSTYTITQTDLADEEISSIVTTLTKEPWQKSAGENADYASDEDYIQQQVIIFKDGHEEKLIYEHGEIKTKETKTIEQIEEEHGDPLPHTLRTAVKISFNLPADANNHCKEFANALCDEKERLMEELGLDNDTYNELAQTAMAIAEKETQMNSIDIRKRLWWKQKGHEVISAIQGGDENCSTGIAQIKLSQWYNNPPSNEEQARLKPYFERAGITTTEDLKDNKKAAIATIIALSSLNRELKASKYQKGVVEAEKLTVTREGWELDSDGIARETGHTKPWQNKITKQDQLLLLWNNKSGRRILASGKFMPQTKDYMYMNVAKKANLKYKLVEDAESRKQAEAKEQELLIRDQETKPYKNMDMNGPMGEIVFMPGMYKNNRQHINSDAEIEALKKGLKDSGISDELIKELTDAIKNKELGFSHGLTSAEISGMTKADIKLLLKHLKTIKDKISDIKTSDGITSAEAKSLREKYGPAISKAEDAFRQEYLTNHSPVYNATKENKKVLREFSTVTTDTNYVTASGERRGYQHEKAKGVNTLTTNGRISKVNEILANSAHKVALKNPDNTDSGQCLTGVKEAMKEAGIDISGMSEQGNTPKYVKNWFEQMVSKGVFTKIEYVEVDDTHAREINESDIKRLPAGYFVLFVPDNNDTFKNQAGHIAITNGNGQGYSDTTDNLGWAQYSNNKEDSGKGEHGKFYIYKLSDNWSVDESTGKLKYNG